MQYNYSTISIVSFVLSLFVICLDLWDFFNIDPTYNRTINTFVTIALFAAVALGGFAQRDVKKKGAKGKVFALLATYLPLVYMLVFGMYVLLSWFGGWA